MATVIPPPKPPSPPVEYTFPTNLPYEDNENMESAWHREQMELLINLVHVAWEGRNYFCGGNMFIHFSEKQVRNRDFRGPDFFVVQNVEQKRDRKYWAVWEENGRYPDFVIELLSPTTAKEDLTTKKKIYAETFKTQEYFCYDPAEEKLIGWRLGNGYEAIPVEEGRMWSEQLQMFVGLWVGDRDGHETTWVRFFDRNGNLLPTGEEKESARANRLAARAEIEEARADKEADRADKEAAAHQVAEAEIERLRKELESLRAQQKKPT